MAGGGEQIREGDKQLAEPFKVPAERGKWRLHPAAQPAAGPTDVPSSDPSVYTNIQLSFQQECSALILFNG